MWNAYWRTRRCCKTTWATLCRIGSAPPLGTTPKRTCMCWCMAGTGWQVRAPRPWPVLVVYGQYRHYTDMTRWKRLDSGKVAEQAELTVQKQFRLNTGEAAAFAKGDIHSIAYGDDTFFIRVTGGMWKSTKRCASIWISRRSRWKIGAAPT